jgi:DNA-directed RNA polymerase specialized sigma24 family protein
LQYLKSCVHSAIEDAYRQQQRWPPEALIWNELSEVLVDEELSPEARVLSRLVREALEWAVWSRLRDEAEVVVATLSWEYGLSPREIQARRSDLFATVQQVYRIKRNILDRLSRDPDIQKLR